MVFSCSRLILIFIILLLDKDCILCDILTNTYLSQLIAKDFCLCHPNLPRHGCSHPSEEKQQTGFFLGQVKLLLPKLKSKKPVFKGSLNFVIP